MPNNVPKNLRVSERSSNETMQLRLTCFFRFIFSYNTDSRSLNVFADDINYVTE